MTALHFRDGQLTTNWTFDSENAGNGAAAGQGDHSAMAADTDENGAQEIITGSLTIGDDGTFRCTTVTLVKLTRRRWAGTTTGVAWLRTFLQVAPARSFGAAHRAG